MPGLSDGGPVFLVVPFLEVTMKRVYAILLSLLLLLSLPAAAQEGQADFANILLTGDYINTLASFEGQLYGLGGQGLYRLDPHGAEPALLSLPLADARLAAARHQRAEQLFEGIESLFVDAEGLLGYDSNSSRLYRIDHKTSPAQHSLLLELYKVGVSVYLSQLKFKSPLLYGYDYAQKTLYQIDISTGEVKSIQAGSVQASAPIEGGRLLTAESKKTADSWEFFLYSYDFAAGTREALAQLPMNPGFSLAADLDGRQVYFAGRNQVLAFAIGQEQAQPICRIPSGDAYSLTLLPGGRIALVVDGELVALRPLDKDAAQPEALKLMDGIGRTADYLSFLKSNPRADLAILQPGTGTEEERFISDMITKNDEVDIYVLKDANLLSQIRKKGYGLDLAQSPQILAATAALELPFQRLVQAEGRILALPKDLSVDLPVHSISRFEQLSYQTPTTYQQYFEYCLDYLKNHQEDQPDIFFQPFENGLDLASVLNKITVELIAKGQPLDYERPEIKSLVGLMAQVAGGLPAEHATAAEWLFYSYDLRTMMEDSARMLLSLTGDSAPVLSIHPQGFSYYVVNPYTRNPALALAFLNSFLDSRNDTQAVIYDSRLTKAIEQPMYHRELKEKEDQLKLLQAELEQLTGAAKSDMEVAIAQQQQAIADYREHSRWWFSQEEVDRVRAMAPSVYIPDFNPIPLLQKEYPAFFEEYRTKPQFDADQFLAQLNQMVQTSLREQE